MGGSESRWLQPGRVACRPLNPAETQHRNHLVITSLGEATYSRDYCRRVVLGSAGTGIISTSSQEGTQPSLADPTRPNSIIVVTVHFLCSSIKLSSLRPTSFAAFSPFFPPAPNPGGERGDRVASWRMKHRSAQHPLMKQGTRRGTHMSVCLSERPPPPGRSPGASPAAEPSAP